MLLPNGEYLGRLRAQLLPVLTGPPVLAFLPAGSLAAYWMGGETALLAVALGLPLIFAALGNFAQPAQDMPGVDTTTGLVLRDGFDGFVANSFERSADPGLNSAIFMLDLDEFSDIIALHGQEAGDHIARLVGDRLTAVLRDGDCVARLGQARFGICLRPVRQLDLELAIQLAGRLQTAIEEVISLEGAALYVSASVGFCLRHRAPEDTPSAWEQAAETALGAAQQVGPSAIRAFTPKMMSQARSRRALREDVCAALENGQIQPWYQPQISTETGKVTGFEALARWIHPEHGAIAPDRFLPAIRDAGLAERLAEIILYHSFTALKAWDSAGLDVPHTSVNFGNEELRNPRLVDRVRWELDRFDLTPDRLCVEVLETVVTDQPEDVVARNLTGLVELGCLIDLDDFGTGQASIGAIRRFSVSRIKIDRSFVTKADRDPEQQKLVSAILTMAEQLELETLAEGVETVGEHALLAQLGCGHAQGFGIARPMPFDQTLDWITSHQAKIQAPPRIGKNA